MKDPMKAATEFVMKVVRNPEAYPQQFVALRRSTVAKILTGERARILDLLEEKGPFAESQLLAQALNRSPSAVARDLRDLEAFGLVERERNGKSVGIRITKKPVLLI